MYIKLPKIFIMFVKQFMFMYISLYLVQRKNVKKFSPKQTAIQSSMLSVGIIMAQYIIKKIENNFEDDEYNKHNKKTVEEFNNKETFPIVNNNESNTITPKTLKLIEYNKPKEEEISVNQVNDFNDKFDDYVKRQTIKPPTPDFEEQNIKEENKINNIIPYINKYTHYNTSPGYTYVDPKAWRVPTPQPPICLTDRPCTTNPVLETSTMGNEFLPYSYVKSSTELQNIEKATV